MAKEVKGWRAPMPWDYKGDDAMLKGLSAMSQSDDGWVCPHCGAKETIDNEGYDEKTMSSSMVVDITPCDGKVLVKISRVNFTPVCM